MITIDLNANLTRTVINDEGEAIRPFRAREMGLGPEVVFVRKDGWMLGATHVLSDVAYNMWKDEWIAKVILP